MLVYVRISTRLTRSTGHDATAMRAHTAPSAAPSALHASAVRLRKRRHQMAAAATVQQRLVDALPAMAWPQAWARRRGLCARARAAESQRSTITGRVVVCGRGGIPGRRSHSRANRTSLVRHARSCVWRSSAEPAVLLRLAVVEGAACV